MNHPHIDGYVPGMTRWGYEARRCGPTGLALPWLGAIAIALVSAAVAGANHDGTAAGAGMVRLVALVFPITAGIAAVAALGREQMAELQLTFPTRYRRTVLRRIALLAATTTAAAAALVLVLAAQDQWDHPAHGPLALLVPLGPAALFIGAGAWALARIRSVGGASVAVVGAWFVELLFLDRLVGVWQVNRVLLLLAGAGLTIVTVRLFDNPERFLRGDRE